MFSLNRKSFTFRMVLTIAVLVLVLQTLLSVILYRMHVHGIKEGLIQEGESLALILSNSAVSGTFAESPEQLAGVVQGILPLRTVLAIRIYNNQWNPLFEERKAPGFLSAVHQLSPAEREKVMKTERFVETSGAFEFIRPVSLEILDDSEAALYENKPMRKSKVIGYVSLAMDKSHYMSEVHSLLFTVFGVTLLLLLSGALIIYVLVDRASVPLRHFAEAAERIGRGEDAVTIHPGPYEEISQLADAFNRMAIGLEEQKRENKHLMDRLVAVARIEATGTLARGIAHDFNNILTILRGYVHIMRQRTTPTGFPSSCINNMDVAIDRMSKLVRDLIAFSSNRDVSFENVEINTLIDSLEKPLLSALGEGIAYQRNLCAHIMNVRGNPSLLEQVLMNLIHNAADAMEGVGVLRIMTKEIFGAEEEGPFALDETRRFALIEISDTGPGIADEVKSKMYEPYFSTKEKGRNSGLGLSIVYGIVKDHKGLIQCRSEMGQGTTFAVYFPLVEL
ncbi:MAG: ATP-binding protein [Thermodesulfovibrionales bacterium]